MKFLSLGALRGAVLAAFAVMLLVPSLSYALDSGKKAELEKALATFTRATLDSDFATIVENALPPRMLNFISKKAGITPEALKEGMLKTTAEVAGMVKFVSFKFDFAAADFKELPNGEPYVFIPTETVMMVKDQKAVAKDHTVALIEGGRWYLLRISSPQQEAMMREIYPEFQNVEFPRGKMELEGK